MGEAKTRQELALLYGISTKTFKKWLNREGINLPRGLISPKDQKKIFEKLGIPINSD